MPMSTATSRPAPSCPKRAEKAMASRNISVSETSRPKLPRHAKLKFDETRKVWVILAPERVLAPDEIAVEVLQLCDGERSVSRYGRSACRQIRRPARGDRDRRRRHAAGPRRQGLFHRSAREDVMSGIVTDSKTNGGRPERRAFGAGAAPLDRRNLWHSARGARRAAPTAARCNAPIAPTRSSSTAPAASSRPRNGRRC